MVLDVPSPGVVARYYHPINGHSTKGGGAYAVFSLFSAHPAYYSRTIPSPPAAEPVNENFLLRDFGERTDMVCSVPPDKRRHI